MTATISEREKIMFIELSTMTMAMKNYTEKMIEDIRGLGLGDAGEQIIERLEDAMSTCSEERIADMVKELFPEAIIKGGEKVSVTDMHISETEKNLIYGRFTFEGKEIPVICDITKDYLVVTGPEFQEELAKKYMSPQGKADLIGNINESLQKEFMRHVKNHPEILEELKVFRAEEKEPEKVVINDEEMDLIDRWHDEYDFVLACITDADGEWYYAEVNDRTVLEFDYRPDRDQVYSDYIDYLSGRDLNKHEAEFGADGKKAFGSYNGEEREEKGSGLPEKCYSIKPTRDEIILITRGESGYEETDLLFSEALRERYANAANREEVVQIKNEINEALGVTREQEEAMLAGSMFGWDIPAADPKTYEQENDIGEEMDMRDELKERKDRSAKRPDDIPDDRYFEASEEPKEEMLSQEYELGNKEKIDAR